MMIAKFRTTATALTAAAVLCTGLAVAARVAAGAAARPIDDPPAVSPPTAAAAGPQPKEPRHEVWPLSLRDAIWVALDNSDQVRIIRVGVGAGAAAQQPEREGVIAPRSAGTDVQQFRAAVMAEIRSIEQQYWNLALTHVRLWAVEQELGLISGILAREEARLKVGQSNAANVAEISQRLDQVKLDLVTRTSDVITSERRLRELMGMPLADDRRIIPIAKPIDEKISPDWQQCLAAMNKNHPEVVRARQQAERANPRIVTAAELRQVAGTFLPLLDPAGLVPSASGAAIPAAAFHRESARLEQVVHQATHSLARFVLGVDANYKQYQAAAALRAAAVPRLETERGRFDRGETTVDRLLGAVSQYAVAVSNEAFSKASYASSLVSLEEAQGTLLDHENIRVAQAVPRTASGSPAGADALVPGPTPLTVTGPVPATAPLPPTAPAPPDTAPTAATPVGPAAVPPALPAAGGPRPGPDGTTYSFHLTVGAGARPFEVRGSFTVAPARDER